VQKLWSSTWRTWLSSWEKLMYWGKQDYELSKISQWFVRPWLLCLPSSSLTISPAAAVLFSRLIVWCLDSKPGGNNMSLQSHCFLMNTLVGHGIK
jgi:hypothetical protein